VLTRWAKERKRALKAANKAATPEAPAPPYCFAFVEVGWYAWPLVPVCQDALFLLFLQSFLLVQTTPLLIYLPLCIDFLFYARVFLVWLAVHLVRVQLRRASVCAAPFREPLHH
jgi:hypothetical protein